MAAKIQPSKRRGIQTRCVACGCTDFAACAPACAWLWVDRHAHVGLCSSPACRRIKARPLLFAIGQQLT